MTFGLWISLELLVQTDMILNSAVRNTRRTDNISLSTPKETEVGDTQGNTDITTKLEITNTVGNVDTPQPFSYSIKLFDEAGNDLTGEYEYQRFTSLTGAETDITDTVSIRHIPLMIMNVSKAMWTKKVKLRMMTRL